MSDLPTSVRNNSTPEFTQLYRQILYSQKITWGAKCLAFAIIDLPLTAKPKIALLARKIGSSSSQVSIWSKELRRHKLMFRHEKKQA